jgi:hypothetical protein
MKMKLSAVLLSFWFAVVGGTIGPFDTAEDCRRGQVIYKAGAPDQLRMVPWVGECWETKR